MVTFVILDRDGVINHDARDYIKTADEWEPLPGSLEAIASLKRLGIPVYIATNQAGIGRGKLTESALETIHEKLLTSVRHAGGEIRAIRFCPHHPDDHCACRKPKPGLLLALARDYGLTLSEGYYVGDSLKDLRAAEAAGCKGVLVKTGNGVETARLRPDHEMTYDNLQQFVDETFGHRTRDPND